MNPIRTRLSLLAAAAIGYVLAVPGVSTAEVGGVHLNITPYAGFPVWAKEVNLEEKPVFGGRLGLMFGKYLGIEGTWGKSSAKTQSNSLPFPYVVADPLGISRDTNLEHVGGDVIFHLLPNSTINPYLLGGWQEVTFEIDEPANPKNVEHVFNGWEAAAGLKIYLADRWAIRLEARDVFWRFDSPPAPDPPAEDFNHNMIYTAGLQLSVFGSADKDTDQDGVGDKKDECPNTPLGAVVDERGCPIDSDSDGVPDGIDQCANTPAGARVDEKGCPIDSDNDGVFDGIDQCPDTPAGTRVDARGCPLDSDNDGVPDGLDLCPNTPQGARVDKDGCPIEISEKEVELLDTGKITVRNIYFDTAKWDIKPQSENVLNELGRIFIQWPQLEIEVGGHADARGSNAYNLDLSDKRANAVKDWLLEHYPQIDRAKFSAKGYGEEVPVASNKTTRGMALNRRVEFRVLNPDELQKVRERRRLLQKGE